MQIDTVSSPEMPTGANVIRSFGFDIRFAKSRLVGSECQIRSTSGPAHRRLYYDAVLGSIGSQMLILRVSGIRKSASTKHTAGTTIG